MLFPAATLAQMQGLSDESLGHTCALSDGSGAVYTGACQVYDDTVMVRRMTGGDASFDAEALIRLPHQSRSGWSRKVFDQDHATVEATYEGITQTGRVAKVMRKQAMCFLAVNWLDAAEVAGTLGTISDLSALDTGAGAVLLVFTPAAGAASHQAQVGGVNAGAAVDGVTGVIALSGLAAGSKSFRVVASDGSATTNSNAVSHVVT